MKLFIGKFLSCDLNYQHYYIFHELRQLDQFEITEDPSEADIIVFPATAACSDNHMQETINYIEEVLAKKKKSATTYLTGCLTREFTRPELDYVKKWLEQNIDHIIPQNEPNILLKQIAQEAFKKRRDNSFGNFFIKKNSNGILVGNLYISGGCLNNCSFCNKGCYQKAPLKSAPLDEVLWGITQMGNEGIENIELIGTNISQYGLDINGTFMLKELIKHIEQDSKIKNLALTGFAFKDAIHNDFADILRDSTKLRIINGGLESGSDRILEMMRKGYSSEEFLDFINTIRQKYDISLILNIIAGFPTETSDDINLTLEVLRQVNPMFVNVIEYINSRYVGSNQYPQLNNQEIENHAEEYMLTLSKRGTKSRIIKKPNY